MDNFDIALLLCDIIIDNNSSIVIGFIIIFAIMLISELLTTFKKWELLGK